MVKEQLQVMHSGLISRFNRYKWVRQVWPILERCRTTSSRLLVILLNLVSPSVGLIDCNLLKGVWLHISCQILRKRVLIICLKSVQGSFRLSETGNCNAAFAVASAFSFPLIPTWLGNQQKFIVLPDARKKWHFSRISVISLTSVDLMSSIVSV